MVVNPLQPVSVSIIVDQNNICTGTTVTFTSTAINGGSAPVYQWYKNSVPVGTNQPTYACIPANGDQVYVVMTSSLTCISGNPATSNFISMVVYQIPVTPVATANGQILESNAPNGNQWYHEGILIQGATGQIYFATESGWYWTIVTLNGCSSAESNHVYVIGVGIDEKSESAKFQAYPVPNDGRFTILITIPYEETFKITIYNNIGLKLYELIDVKVKGRFKQEMGSIRLYLEVSITKLFAGLFVSINNRSIRIKSE
jgi:hypothetical protein